MILTQRGLDEAKLLLCGSVRRVKLQIGLKLG
jgi:hypothetical protein